MTTVSLLESTRGRAGVWLGNQCRTAACSVHAVRQAMSFAWRDDCRLPATGVQPVRDRTRRPEQTPDMQPRVSSELIAFVSDREGSDALFVMRSDGSDVRRLTGELPPCPTQPGRRTGNGSHSMPDQ